MNLLGRRAHGGKVERALAVIAFLTAATMTSPLVVTAQAASTTHPACQATQIKVTAGPMSPNVTYDVKTVTGEHKALAREAVPVYFYDMGSTCHLLMGSPIFRAVKSTTDIQSVTVGDLSMPAGADNEIRQVVEQHERVETLFVIVKLPGVIKGHCDPATTTGFLVSNYADPITTTHFFARKLHDVCFYSGPGQIAMNSGAVWFPPQ
jgi:hypothetical protein